jgi:hypothetical protein
LPVFLEQKILLLETFYNLTTTRKNNVFIVPNKLGYARDEIQKLATNLWFWHIDIPSFHAALIF